MADKFWIVLQWQKHADLDTVFADLRCVQGDAFSVLFLFLSYCFWSRFYMYFLIPCNTGRWPKSSLRTYQITCINMAYKTALK